MRAQVHGELAGVAAGVGADLALEGPLVRVDAEVLVEAAAVGRRVVTRLALVRLHARVATHVRLELILPAEALAADFALVGLVSFKHTHRWHQKTTGKKKKASVLSCSDCPYRVAPAPSSTYGLSGSQEDFQPRVISSQLK